MRVCKSDSDSIDSWYLNLSLPVQGVLEEVSLLQEINEAARACVRAFVEDRTDSAGRVSKDSFANFARMTGLQAQPWEQALKVRGYAKEVPGAFFTFLSRLYCSTTAINRHSG